jgi:hypothetical protein
MKSQFASVAFSTGLALAVAGCATGSDGSSEGPNTQAVGQQQRHLASASFALENAYDVQYAKGQVDANALQPLIYDVLEAMPEQARPQAQAHIYDVITSGEKDAKNLTPEQRAQVAAPVSADKMGPQQVEQIGAWGWGGLGMGGLGYGAAYGAGYGLGWGGLGAFGFPGYAGLGWGW